MEKTYTIPSHVELTIKRPNGNTEIVRHPKFDMINDNMFNQMVVATKAAGKGEILSYKNVTITKERTERVMENARRAKIFQDTNNEGCSDGYNPYHKS